MNGIEILEKEINEIQDKLLEFMSRECQTNSYSAAACYVAMRTFLARWAHIMGPEATREIESQFQIKVIDNNTIASC